MSIFKFKSSDEMNKALKRIFYVAWQNCGGPTGMGWLQDRKGVTEDDVWNNVVNRGDYPQSPNLHNSPVRLVNGKGGVISDYVFGRRMKLGVDFDLNNLTIIMRDDSPRPDYHGWVMRRNSPSYIETYDDLALEALVQLGINADIL